MAELAIPDGFELVTAAPKVAPQSQLPIPDGFELVEPVRKSKTNVQTSAYVGGLIRAAASGATFNFGDEIEAYVRSLGGADRKQALAQIRDEMDAFAEANPGTALAAELAGALAVPGMAGARVAGAVARRGVTSLGGRALTMAGIGGVEGAASGAGKAESEKGDLAEHTLGSGLMGSAVGGALPVIGAAAKPVLQAIGSKLPVIAPRVANSRANQQIYSGLEQEGALENRTVADKLNDWRTAALNPRPLGGGQNLATPATEGGEVISSLAADAAKAAPRAQRQARDYIQQLERARAGEAAAYDTIYALPPKRMPQIDALRSRVPLIDEIYDTATRNLANREGARVAAGGQARSIPQGQYSTEQIHMMDQALGRRMQDLTSRVESERASGSDLHTLQQIQNVWRHAIYNPRNGIPGLEQVTQRYARGSQQLRNAPPETEMPFIDPTASNVSQLIGATANAAVGYKGRLARIVAESVTGGNEEMAEAITRKLLTQFRNSGEINDVIAQIERMAPEHRRRYMNAAVGAISSDFGGHANPLSD